MRFEKQSIVLPLLAIALTATPLVMAHTEVEDGHKVPDTNYRTLNKSLKVGSNVEVGDLTAINGAIKIGDGSTMQDVSSVNGSVQIGEQSHAKSVESVNGGIKLGQNITVDRDVKSVNGGIHLRPGGEVGGNVSTVNGGMTLNDTLVGGNIETYNGDIDLEGNTEIMGDLTVHKSKNSGWRKQDPNEITIGPNATIHGDLYFEKEVKLRIDPSARIGNIHGQEFVENEYK